MALMLKMFTSAIMHSLYPAAAVYMHVLPLGAPHIMLELSWQRLTIHSLHVCAKYMMSHHAGLQNPVNTKTLNFPTCTHIIF